MPRRAFSSITDQVSDQLRRGMVEGRWRGVLPGRKRLAEELGCSHGTVEAAMQRLGKEGLLVSQGAGRRRRIALSQEHCRTRTLRLIILLYEKSDREEGYLIKLLHHLQHAGHDAVFAERTMNDFGMKMPRIARFVEKAESDAWVVVGGSREVLEWFARQPTPAFALFGRLKQVSLPSTSPKKAGALTELIDRLVDLGHRRIVMLAREERRKPNPGFLEQLFLKHLEKRGIPVGRYNLPDWDDCPEGFRRVLNSLFERTPPTALICDQPMLLIAAMQQLASMKIAAPEDVSLACTDSAPALEWCLPAVTHIAWDPQPVINRVVKWAANVRSGKDDRRKSTSQARLVLGGTIGPVPNGR